MAWELEIHTIDVGQGESSLIIAKDTAGGKFKSMLIDGGLAKYGEQVDRFVASKIGNRQLDFIVASHYDIDHSNGLRSIMFADNLSVLSALMGQTVYNAVNAEITAGSNANVQGIAGMAAFVALTKGAYDTTLAVSGGKNASNVIAPCIAYVKTQVTVYTDLDDALEKAYRAAVGYMDDGTIYPNLNEALMKYYGGFPKKIGKITINKALVAPVASKLADTVQVIFDSLAPKRSSASLVRQDSANYTFSTLVPETTTFRYQQAKVYDCGDIPQSEISGGDVTGYLYSVSGRVAVGGDFNPVVPGINRDRVIPDLGAELLGTNADATAPHVYCLARLKKVYGNPGTVSQDNGNGISICVLVQFGNFSFYTGGDLPKDGLDMIPGAAFARVEFGNLASFTGFKAGHHGSSEALSQSFLDAVNPKISVISCGRKTFGREMDSNHPRQDVIDLLTRKDSIDFFYLTNCKIERDGVPASIEKPQDVPNNKSRVAGDNGCDPGEVADPQNPNPIAKVHRGDISITISQAQANATVEYGDSKAAGEEWKIFNVTYFENDERDKVMKTPWGVVTKNIFY